MGRSKKKKRAAKAALKAASRTERLRGRAQQVAADGKVALATTVVPALAVGAQDMRKKTSDLAGQYLPAVQDRVGAQGEKLAAFADNLSPRVQQVRRGVQEDYLPRARRTAGATGTVLTAALSAAVDAARQELDKGQGQIKQAYTAPTPAVRKRRGGKVLLVIGLAALAAGGGFFAWKRTRPVEDPWAPPADFARAHYPASGANDTDSTEVSDAVGGAEAGDVARSLGGGTHAPSTSNTSDRTADTKPHDVKFDSASHADAGKSTTAVASTGTAAAGSAAGSSAARTTHGDASVKGARSESGGTHRGENLPEQGKVIDPVLHPEENPADPEHRGDADGGKRGTHRGDA